MFQKEDIYQLIDSFKDLRILVIGDIMLDSYIWGKVDRISPEAPVPIVTVDSRSNRLGGAANVAVNIKSLGAEAIICSVIGEDQRGKDLLDLMVQDQLPTIGIIKSGNRITTTKFRVIGNKMQLLRVDEEVTNSLDASDEDELLRRIFSIIENNKVDAIIFQDYNKGVLTTNVIKQIIDKANQNNIITTVDPKKDHFFDFKNVSLFKPNLKELREGLNIDINPKSKESLSAAALLMHEKLNAGIVMATLSEDGIFISQKDNGNKNMILTLPAHVRSIADVSGAGDTVISLATLCLAKQQAPEMIAALSNLAGGLVCEEVGVTPVNKEKLYNEALKNLLID